MTEMTSAKLLTEQEKQVTDIRVDESTIARRIKLTGKEEESSSLDRSLILDDNSPTRPSWERFIPGGYRRDKQVPLSGHRLVLLSEVFAGLAILFYGYDQGVMSGVNNSPDYLRLMGISVVDQTKRDSATIGGIVAVYYLGTFGGALIGGSLGDKIGRIKSIFIGCVIATFGAALQASAQNITWMCFARLITGSGTGILNCIVPVWTVELSSASGRGAALGFEFFLNICGLALAYWIEFFLRDSGPSLRWRLPLAIQIIFLLILLATVRYFPESPRWLARIGDEAESLHILARLRTNDVDESDSAVEAEFEKIREVIQVERQSADSNHYAIMIKNTDKFNMGRRVRLIISLQILQELVGIAVVTVYAPTVFQQAGLSAYTADLLSGINDLTYAASVWIAVFTLDRVGRRKTLFTGAVIMGFSLILCGIAGRFVADDALSASQRLQWGDVLIAFVFLYTATFGATWLVTPWLIPAEISPLHCRARGGAFSVIGWSIGNGAIVVLTPFLFNAIGYWTFILFALLNFASIPIIWAFYPETSNRSLEEIDELFEGSVFVPRARKELAEKYRKQSLRIEEE